MILVIVIYISINISAISTPIFVIPLIAVIIITALTVSIIAVNAIIIIYFGIIFIH